MLTTYGHSLAETANAVMHIRALVLRAFDFVKRSGQQVKFGLPLA